MFFKNILPALLWSLLILALTLTPGSEVPKIKIEGLDKVVHFVLFGILMYLSMKGLSKHQKISDRSFNPSIVSFITCIFYGVLIEFLQLYIPGRSYSAYDIIANTSGILTAYFVYYFLNRTTKP